MKRRRTRKLALVAFLALLLAVPGSVYAFRTLSGSMASPLAPTGSGRQSRAPEFLFSFEGSRLDPMVRPVGVLADESGVYVVDSARHTIDIFDQDGEFRSSFGASETAVPLYIARSPLDGRLYVSDRGQRSVLVFETDGDYVGPFEPRASAEATGGPPPIEWAPVALDFAEDGALFVTDVAEDHRVLKFAPDGILQRSVGGTATVEGTIASPREFAFPNGIAVHDSRVYVADSNNGRIQVFDQYLEFLNTTVTGGLPRGIDFLPAATTSSRSEYVLVDALSNDATIRSIDDGSIVQFADAGETRLSYPNGVSVMESTSRIYIADTAGARVQVWGWESRDRSAASNGFSWPVMAGLAALPFLPLLLLRRTRMLVAADFVVALVDAGRTDLLGKRSMKWFVTSVDYEALIREYPEISRWLRPAPYSQPDADALEQDAGLSADEAEMIAASRNTDVLATDRQRLLDLAAQRGIPAIRSAEFLDRFEPHVAQDEPMG